MKLVLKIFALPVLLILAIICLLAKLAQTVSGYAFTLFLFLIVACGIAQSNWLSLGILAGMGLAAFLTLFIIVAACFTLEEWRDGLSDFIRS